MTRTHTAHTRLEPARTPVEAGRLGGATIWLTGLPSAGKSTVAQAVAGRLRAADRAVEVLDGDQTRATLASELGFSREHRDLNVARVGYVARLLARNGVLVLAALVSPYEQARAALRATHEADGVPFALVHVATPVDVCRERDVKGLYARQSAGLINGLTGVDDPYETPSNPDLVIETHSQQPEESAQALYALLIRMGLA